MQGRERGHAAPEPFYEPLINSKMVAEVPLAGLSFAALAPTVHGATTAHGFFERLESLTQSASLWEEFKRLQAVRLSKLTDQTALSRDIGVYVSQAIERFERRRNYPIDLLL